MTRREVFSEAIRAAVAPIEAKAAAPEWTDDVIVDAPNLEVEDLWEAFARNLSAVNGTPLIGFDAVAGWLSKKGYRVGYCDPDLKARLSPREAFAPFELRDEFDRSVIDDYEFGITNGSAAIATTGTVVLKDRATPYRLAALAPWVHVAVVTPQQLLPNVPAALAALGDDPSVIWATGPSKTADVEGILIEGAHGPGIQVVCLDRSA